MPNFTVPPRVFDPTFRDRVRDANPLAHVINEDLRAAGHPPLAGKGEEVEGWHPAHGSASGRSLKVNTTKQVYCCFNCGEAGDVFTWVMHAHSSMFVEALHCLAARAGIPVPSLDPLEQQHWRQLQQERHDLEALFRAAADFFHEHMAQEHIDFCKAQWGLTLETVQQYKLGFSPTVPDALQQYLRRKLFAEDTIQKSGLVVQVGNRWHDFFQGRIVFPYWRDLPNGLSGLPGTPLYFIGRRLDGTTPEKTWEQAKYKKQLVHGAKHPYVSPTITNTYFYGEHTLRGLKDRPILVTEGVADCLVALQANIPAISPVTVRFSKACYPRLLQLARHAQRILICNDNEDTQAGMKGALATAAFLDAAGMDVRLVTLPRPDGVSKIDLADFLKSHTAEDFQRLCDEALAYLDARLATYPVSGEGYANCQTARQFVTEVLSQCLDRQKALAFLRHRVKKHFKLTGPDVTALVTGYQEQQRQKPHRRIASDARLADDPEDAGDKDGLLANVGDAEDLDGLAAGARQDDTHGFTTPYRATPQGLVWEKPTKEGTADVLLTNFTATITAEITEDDGTETRLRYALAVQLKGKPYCCEMLATQLAGMSWVAEHLGATAIVMPGMTLKDHARAAIQLLSQHITHQRVYTHLGWRKLGAEWGYLHAGGAIGAQGVVPEVTVRPGEALALYHLPAPPAGEAACAALRASFRVLDVAEDAVTIPSFATVWRAALGNADFGAHLTGPTGQGKTELAALLQQHWGARMDARHLPASWSSTGNALEGLAFYAKDAVLVVDDFCPTGAKADIARYHREADRLVRAQGNHSGRQRMRQDSTLRPVKPPRGLILSTGEDVPRGQSLRARLLILDVSPGTVQWDTLTACQGEAAAGLYTQALAGFIHWLAPRYGEVSAGVPAELRTLRHHALHSGHRRTADIIANLALGVQYVLAYGHACGAFTVEECWRYWERTWQALSDVAAAQQEHQAGEEPVSRFLALLAGIIAGGHAHVADARTLEAPRQNAEYWGWREQTVGTGEFARDEWRPLGPCIGWVQGDRLYLEPEAAFHTVQRFAEGQQAPLSITQRTLWKRMREHGMIVTQPSQTQNTVSRDIGPEKKSKRVLDMPVALLSPENSINSIFSMQGAPVQQNQADLPDCFPSWYGQKQYGASDENSMPEHAGLTPHARPEQHTVLPPDPHTDFGEETVGTNDAQSFAQSAPHTVHTDHTVFSPMTEGNCPRCGADYVTLVQRHDQPACVGCSLLSDDELARMRPPMPTNGTHAPATSLPLQGQTAVPVASPANVEEF